MDVIQILTVLSNDEIVGGDGSKVWQRGTENDVINEWSSTSMVMFPP
jgi:hypothetical protein